jgi:predicted Zn finger-like uncharacterized protein
MSLITRCPTCGTMFKVVPDQLRISEGWVRCGQCAGVFDATSSLQHEDSAAPAEPPPSWTPAPAPGPVTMTVAPPAAMMHSPAPRATPVEPVSPEAVMPDLSAAQALRADDLPLLSRPSALDDESPSQYDPSQYEDQMAADTDLQDLSFVRQARRKAFWRRPWVRALAGVLVLMLGGLLALQYAVHDRDRLAAVEPALRPWLVALCQPLHCRVAPLRQVDSVVIDSSSFSKLRTDAYRLNVTLKNQAAVDLAMPSVELTLTDTQDHPVIRRVLQPSDLGAVSIIPAASDWSGSITLTTGPGSARIAGYRLLAFYP